MTSSCAGMRSGYIGFSARRNGLPRLRRNVLSVLSLSMSAATTSPLRGVIPCSSTTRSPSMMHLPIIESPRTCSANVRGDFTEARGHPLVAPTGVDKVGDLPLAFGQCFHSVHLYTIRPPVKPGRKKLKVQNSREAQNPKLKNSGPSAEALDFML